MHARVLILFIALGAVATAPAFAAKTILFYDSECCRNITEGEFAILYCQALDLREPAQGWTVQSAAAALSTLGHQPEGGWVLSRFLTESTMSRLLRNSKLYRKPFSEPEYRSSTRLVTIANARNVVPSENAITQGEFAVLLARALSIPAPTRPSPEAAIKLLTARPIPLKPLAGWQVDAPLIEAAMLEILSPTPFRATSVDASAEISPLQAFSLLFSRFEIATQGHFGLYIVEALGIPPPQGGWTMQKALDYVEKEFGVGGGYGMHRNAPLCADFFVNSLREILVKLWQPANTPQLPAKGASALLRLLKGAADPSGESAAADPFFGSFGSFRFVAQQGDGKSSGAPQGGRLAGPSARDVDKFIKDVRSSGLLPSDRCQSVAAQGFSKAQQGPIGPVAAPPPQPPEAPKEGFPASPSRPIPPL